MAYDRESILLSWLFEITGSDETAVTTLHVTGDVGFDAVGAWEALTNSSLDQIGLAMRTLTQVATLQHAAYARMLSVKAAPLTVTGRYATDAPKQRAMTAYYGAYPGVIPQSTIVLSTHSALARGRANRGRMFLPYTQLEFGSTSFGASPATTAAVALDFATFINAVNDVFVSGTPGIDTPKAKIMSKLDAGVTREITRVGCGRITDTQQRRRRQLSEDESYADL